MSTQNFKQKNVTLRSEAPRTIFMCFHEVLCLLCLFSELQSSHRWNTAHFCCDIRPTGVDQYSNEAYRQRRSMQHHSGQRRRFLFWKRGSAKHRGYFNGLSKYFVLRQMNYFQFLIHFVDIGGKTLFCKRLNTKQVATFLYLFLILMIFKTDFDSSFRLLHDELAPALGLNLLFV